MLLNKKTQMIVRYTAYLLLPALILGMLIRSIVFGSTLFELLFTLVCSTIIVIHLLLYRWLLRRETLTRKSYSQLGYLLETQTLLGEINRVLTLSPSPAVGSFAHIHSSYPHQIVCGQLNPELNLFGKLQWIITDPGGLYVLAVIDRREDSFADVYAVVRNNEVVLKKTLVSSAKEGNDNSFDFTNLKFNFSMKSDPTQNTFPIDQAEVDQLTSILTQLDDSTFVSTLGQSDEDDEPED